MVFPARRSWCLATIVQFLFLGLIGCLLAADFGNFLRNPSAFHLGQLALWSLYTIYYLANFFWTRYEITGTELIIRNGLSHRRVPLDRIYEVVPTRGGFIGSAWSHDALKIRFIRERIASDSIIISPRYKAGFLAELACRSPRLQPCGEGLSVVERDV